MYIIKTITLGESGIVRTGDDYKNRIGRRGTIDYASKGFRMIFACNDEDYSGFVTSIVKNIYVVSDKLFVVTEESTYIFEAE